MPKLATEPFLKLWEQDVFALLLAEGKITEAVVANIRSWKHFLPAPSEARQAGGFSVVQSVCLDLPAGSQVEKILRHCGLWKAATCWHTRIGAMNPGGAI